MIRSNHVAGLALAAVLLGGCYAYDPYYYPYGYTSLPAAYDRSWNAALGALADNGMEIVAQDRTAGFIEGRRGGMGVRVNVVTQPDGRIRVEFNHAGNAAEDPGLPERITRAYNARMGRG